TKVSGPRRIKAAAYNRKVASELGVDIELVEGTSKDGRITVEDVQQYAQKEKSSATTNDLEEKVSKVQISEKQTSDKKEMVKIIPYKGRCKQISKKTSKQVYRYHHVQQDENVAV